jgi:hypothetical protein
MTGQRIGFTGHQGLTRDTEQLVGNAIKQSLEGLTRPTGICSLAEGSDQLFARELLAGGGELVVVLPCREYEKTFSDPSALADFRSLLDAAHDVIRLTHVKPSEAAFWDAGKRVVRESSRIIAVWDGQPAAGLGGTADVVAYAREHDKEVEVIWPAHAARS